MTYLLRAAPLLLLLSAGCARAPITQAEVSGKVLYRGQPLPGGIVTFMSERGYSGTAVIGADGTYQVKAPLGELKVGVDNRMLQRAASGGGYRMAQPAAEAGAQQPLSGRYVALPEKYHSVDTSGLTCSVSKEPLTFDIRLD